MQIHVTTPILSTNKNDSRDSWNQTQFITPNLQLRKIFIMYKNGTHSPKREINQIRKPY